MPVVSEQEQKEFALAQLAPYFKDPSTCGFNEAEEKCEYRTKEGKMCVAGKNFKEGLLEKEFFKPTDGIYSILVDHEQVNVFKPEVVGILMRQQWHHMQCIHDSIAKEDIDGMHDHIDMLGLFTYEELEEAASKL